MANVNIYTEEINSLVLQRGHWAEWERAAVCHCVTRDSGQPNFLCPTCGGSGYRYLPAKRIKVAVSSISSRIELETLETREPGTAYITPTDDIVMGYKDRLRFPDFRCIFSEVLHWSEEDDGRGISPKTYRNIKDVVYLADDRFEYEVGVDFEITEDEHHLRWINEDYIDQLDGRNMSLLYYTTPSYLVTDLLHELRATLSDRKTPEATFRELPKQYKINREDFIYLIGTPEPIKQPVLPEQPDEPSEQPDTPAEGDEETSETPTEKGEDEFQYDEDGGIII